MEPALVVGCTGLVGSHIVSNLLANQRVFSPIHTISRRPLTQSSSGAASTALQSYTSTETASWAPHISSLSPAAPKVFFSALGTTRAAAGGLENQRKLEHGLNLELAKAAKAAGTKIYVLISAGGANSGSLIPYSKLKGDIEHDIQHEVGFDHTIILRPALIIGQREQSRPAEGLFQGLASALGWLNQKYLKDPWAQDADVIARSAIAAAEKIQTGQRSDKVWILGGADIIRLGRTEWPSSSSPS